MDRDDIIKFRRICKTFLDSKQMTRKQIAGEIGLSEPSVVKALTVPIQDLKGLRASTLGAIQDFNKKHQSDADYIDAGPPPESVEEQIPIDPKREYDPPKKETQREIANEAAIQNTFWSLINEAARCVPDNIKIIVEIQSKKI